MNMLNNFLGLLKNQGKTQQGDDDMEKTKALGRGLSALLGDDVDLMEASPNFQLLDIDIELIEPNFQQPRKTFSEESLNELADSIRENGIIQPIIVRKIHGDHYQIIAGERRWRASKIAGLTRIPAIVGIFSEQQILPIALIENIQRQDLTPVEEAESYNKLLNEHEYTQEELAKILGKTRSYISNIVRLVNLPLEIKDMLNNQLLTAGHARALLNAENNLEIAQHVVNNNLNVRETEELIKNWGQDTSSKATFTKTTNKIPQNEDIKSIEMLLSTSLGMKVSIEETSRGGKLSVHFTSLEQLDTILQKLSETV